MRRESLALALLLAAVSLANAQNAPAAGTPGTRGVPELTAGAALDGSLLRVDLAGALGHAPVFLIYSPLPGPTRTPFGVLGAGPQGIQVLAAARSDGFGRCSFSVPLPVDAARGGAVLNLQCAVLDRSGRAGMALSNPVSKVLFGCDLDVDTDRDGQVETDGADDDPGEDAWSAAKGAVFVYNNDDDDADGQPDALDSIVNGPADALDLAPVLVRALPALPGDWSGELTVDAGAAGWVRLFRADGGGWVEFDPAASNPIAAADLRAGIAFGIEALDYAQTAAGAPGKWNGEVRLTLSLKNPAGLTKSQDAVCLRVAPFLLYSNLAPGETAYVVKKTYTLPFLAALGPPVAAAGAWLDPIDGISMEPSYGIWAQDAFEFGYATMPSPSGSRHLPAVLRSPRGESLDQWAKDYRLGPDFGYVHKGWVRSNVGWIDWFGNLDCAPPLPGWPLGRVYTGYQGSVTMHPAVLEFIDAQAVQGPVLQIDTDWLLIGHVDETICFVPASSGTPYRMLVPSTALGLQILEDLAAAGKSGLKVFEGKSSETTVGGILSNAPLVSYNIGLQSTIDGVREQMKVGLGVAEEDIIDIPALFADDWGGRGVAYMPNMVNALVLGSHFVAADPFGPVDGPADKFKEPVIQALTPLGLTVHFVDDWYPYHEWLGEVHCGTNAVRTPPALPWWQCD